MKEIFYPAGGCSLSDFRFHYQEIWAVFEKACLAKKKAMPHLSDEIPLYNPEYLYQQLARIATESFPSRREQLSVDTHSITISMIFCRIS